MKEDILEQLVDDYLQSQGYFTRHNIKFRPRKEHSEFNSRTDSNHSDIDVIGLNSEKEQPGKSNGSKLQELAERVLHPIHGSIT